MKAENLRFNDGSEGKVVENFGEEFPYVGVAVLPQALVVESVHLSDLPRFVVASEDRNSIRESHLERDKQGHCFY